MNLKLHQVISTLKQAKILFFISLMVTVSFSAKADYKSEIIESCKQYQAGTDGGHINACKLYIDGFIDAAVYTDSALIVDEKYQRTLKEQSPLMQRVYQTRSTGRVSTVNEGIDYKFCLLLDQDRKLIASKVAKLLNVSELESKPLKKILSETLSRAFPCEQ